jgi:hypothetical protein
MDDEKPRRGRGRPSRAEASRKALAGIDPSTADPLDVLRAVAADCSAPASARVSAAKALLADKLDREIRRANEEAMADWASPSGGRLGQLVGKTAGERSV